jgi:predicted MFS family arabinose efflux permease
VSSNRKDFDHKLSTTVLISILYPLGPAAIILMPMIVGGVVDSYGFTEQQAGVMASLEGMGLVVASILATLWIRKRSWTRVLFFGLLLTAALNLISSNLDDFIPLVVVRFFAGLMGGTVFAIAVVALGDNREPDRAFGIAQAMQGAMMFVAFASAPVLMRTLGVSGIFYMLAAASLLMMLSLFRFPDQGVNRSEFTEETESAGSNTRLIWLGLFASFLFFLNIFGFWAFVERIGQAAQISPTTIGLALGVSQIAAIGGALAAALASDRYGRILPLLIVLVGQSLVLWVLVGKFGSMTFFVGTSVFQALFMVAVSYQMGAIARIDTKGKFLVLMTAAQGLGAAFGPSLAAALIREGDNYVGINLMAGLCCALGLLLFFFIISRSHQLTA